MKFSKATKEQLKHYVYGLIDPQDNKIFYVGKASSNNRAYDHLKADSSSTKKSKIITSIRQEGNEPIVEILRYGLATEDIAFEVEAAIIDALGLENLANEVRGHGIQRGRIHADDVERLHGSKPIQMSDIDDKYMLFYIKNSYSPTLSEQELYDTTRYCWHDVAEHKRHSLEYNIALAIVDGVVVRAYSIAGWFPANTTCSSKGIKKFETNKWEFVGQILTEHPLLGKMLVTDEGDAIPSQRKGYSYIN
jgi:uncharacterized protein